jgi:hypothetical protein
VDHVLTTVAIDWEATTQRVQHLLSGFKLTEAAGQSRPTRRGGDGLQTEWEERYSSKHKRSYWANRTTREKSWTKPAHVEGETLNPLSMHDPVLESGEV